MSYIEEDPCTGEIRVNGGSWYSSMEDYLCEQADYDERKRDYEMEESYELEMLEAKQMEGVVK